MYYIFEIYIDMNHKFILFDIDDDIVNGFNKYFNDLPNFQSVKYDVIKLVNEGKIDMTISPANMYGFMDGGIDLVYMKIFSGIEDRVKAKYAIYNIYDEAGRNVMPIGSATTVLTNHPKCKYLLAAPTMKLPGNVKGSLYPYYAFTAILKALRGVNTPLVIGIPGLTTGIGMISGEECGKQMRLAYNDFIRSNERLNFDTINIVSDKPGEFVIDRIAYIK